MTTAKSTLILLFLWMVSVASLEASEIVPDETVQAQIDATAIRLRSGVTQVEGVAVIKQLEQAYTNKSFLVQQVILYLRFKANTEERGYGAIVILNELDVDKATKIKAAMPLLDASDGEMQKIAAHVLRSTDKDRTHVEGVDFAVYERILGETPTAPPTALIRYMYDRNPQAALLSMSRVYGSKAAETEVSEKLKGDPKATLQALADRPEWWARLYVAEMMKKQPQLRDAALLKKLENDDNPLVKEKVAEVTSGK